jgi:hypothetical protein
MLKGTAQEALEAGTQEPSLFDQHRYRWLTHESKICNRRQRGRSDASVVPFLDIWAIEFHKRHGRILRQHGGGENGVVDPLVLPFHRSQISTKFREFERGTHAICERHPFKNTIDDASGDTESGGQGDVLGDKPSAAYQGSKTDVEGLARYPEARQLHHHPSVCESCEQGIGVPLTPSASRDISEAIARLQAEKMAAEVEASRSMDQPQTLRSPLPENPSADGAHNKAEPTVKTPTQSVKEGKASAQGKPRQGPTPLSAPSSTSLASSVREPELEEPVHTQSLTRAASTIHLKDVVPNVPKAEPPTDALVGNTPLNQPTTNQPLVYNSGAKSMPALPTRSTPHSDQPSRFHEIMSSEPEETPTIVRPAEDTQSLAPPKSKHRFHWRRLMGLRKPKSKPNKHQQ